MKYFTLIIYLLIAFTDPATAQQTRGIKLSPGLFQGESIDHCAELKQHAFMPFNVETNEQYGYDVKYVRMNLYIDPAQLYISGSVTSLIQFDANVTSIDMELITDFTIDSIMYEDTLLTFQHIAPFFLMIHFPRTMPDGSIAEIEIYYHGVPSAGSAFGSVGMQEHEGVPALWTLSEPYGARDWWPGKNDLTDKIDSLDMLITTPAEYRAASNGLLVWDNETATTRTSFWSHKYPIAPYLVAFAVTNYAVYTDTTYSLGKLVPVINYVYPENLEEIRENTKATASLMELYSNLFTEYPFSKEKYGHAQFGWGGGMEHQTMSFMGRFDLEIIAHELAHQWFGDMVTLNSWHDIWLNEGFATYLTGLMYEDGSFDYYWPRWLRLSINSVVSLPDGSVYVDDTTDSQRIFNSRLSYRKGALVLHMMRWKIGDEAFFQACRNYLNDPDAKYGFASTDMLKDYMEEAGGMDLTEFFNDWYFGEGYPSYVLEMLSNENDSYTAQLSQTTSHPSVDFFEMPVPVKLYGAGRDTVIIFNHEFNNQTYHVDPGFKIDSIKIDPNMWLISAHNQILLDTAEPNQTPVVNLFPNPAGDHIRVSVNKRDTDLEIYDIKGSKVLEKPQFNQFEWLDISGLRQGVYIVKLKGESFNYEIRLVKL